MILVSFSCDENILNFLHKNVCSKATESYASNWWVVEYLNYVSMRLLFLNHLYFLMDKHVMVRLSSRTLSQNYRNNWINWGRALKPGTWHCFQCVQNSITTGDFSKNQFGLSQIYNRNVTKCLSISVWITALYGYSVFAFEHIFIISC